MAIKCAETADRALNNKVRNVDRMLSLWNAETSEAPFVRIVFLELESDGLPPALTTTLQL